MGMGVLNVFDHAPELQMHNPLRMGRHIRRMRHHDNGAALFVQLMKNIHDGILVRFIQVAGRLVRKD